MSYPFRQSIDEHVRDRAKQRNLDPIEEADLRECHQAVVAWAGKLAARTRDARVEHPSSHPGVGGGPAEYFDSHCGEPVPAVDDQGRHRYSERGHDYTGYLQFVRRFPRGENTPDCYMLRLFGVEDGYRVDDGPDDAFRPLIDEWALPVHLPDGPLSPEYVRQTAAFECCLAGLERAMNYAAGA